MGIKLIRGAQVPKAGSFWKPANTGESLMFRVIGKKQTGFDHEGLVAQPLDENGEASGSPVIIPLTAQLSGEAGRFKEGSIWELVFKGIVKSSVGRNVKDFDIFEVLTCDAETGAELE